MDTVRLSIVLINWNRFDDVSRCIRHLARVRFPSCEIIVVDNGSTDGSADRLAAFGSIRLIRCESNIGPAAARNLGIDAALGPYVLFLDSDALITRRGVKGLVASMDRDPTVGVLGCRIVNGFTRRLDQWIYAEPAETHERVEFETYSFSAAGAIARTDALRKAGLFWTELFIYNEEVDLSIRVIRAGYKILYCPDVAVFHFPSARGRTGPDAYWRCQIRNWIWIFYRYYPAAERRRKVAIYSLIYIIKGLRNRQLRSCLSGIMAGLRQTEIIGQYADKLSEEEIRRLGALNTRTRIRAGR